MKLPYALARPLILEGDVLLFRGAGLTGWGIGFAGRGKYSHAAMASWRGKQGESLLECVEFREWKGGRTVSLSTQVEQFSGRIDLYRVAPDVVQCRYDEKTRTIVHDRFKYHGKAATDLMRELTGLPYGWKRIVKLACEHLAFTRLFERPSYDDNSANIYPVCSTAVAAAVRRSYVDLIPNLADSEVTPSDLSRSSYLTYLFTIE